MGKKLLLFLFLAFIFLPLSIWGQACPTSVNISSDTGSTICKGTPVEYTATPNGGTGPFTYEWKINNVVQSETSNQFVTSGLTNGQTVSVTVIDANGTSCSITNNGSPITVNPNLTPTVNFTIPAGTKCTGQNITFTASNTNGGSNANYEWFVDGSSVQNSTNNKLTRSFSGDGTFDIKVVLTSTINCVTSQTAEVIKQVTITPNATLSTSNANLNGVCLNQPITPLIYNIGGSATGATASGLPPGVTGSYSGGTFTISGSPTSDGNFNYNVTTQGPCGNVVEGGTIEIVKDATISLSSGSNDQVVCQGENIENIVYSIGETGNNATVNGLPGDLTTGYSGGNFTISGSSTQTGTFNYSIYATGSCGNSSTLNGTLTINENLTPAVTITSSDADNIICEGTEVTFTASPTNGGSNPSYQWKVGNQNVGNNSNEFITTSLAIGDQPVSVVLTSSETCVTTAATVTSNEIVTTVNENLTPEVTITATDSDICPGDEVIFSIASITNEGSNPTYQWKLDGSNVGSNSSTYSTTTLTDGQTITLVITSSETCLTTSSATSNELEIEVFPPAPSTPGVISGEIEVCSSSTGLVYSIPPVTNAESYDWSFPTGWSITSGDGTDTVTVNAGSGSGDISVKASNICGDSSSESILAVTSINGVPPNPGSIFSDLGGNNNICPPYLVTFSVTSSGPHQWTVPAGWEIISGAGTNTIEVSITNAATSGTREVSVVAQNICGNSSPSVYGNIEINDHIIADFGEDQTICKTVNSVQLTGTRSFGNATLNVNFSSSGTGAFSNSTAGGSNKNGAFSVNYTPSAADKASGQVVLTMTVPEPKKQDNAGNDCGESSDSVILNIIRDATISNPANKDQTVCINNAVNNIVFNVSNAGTGASVTGLPAGLSGNFNSGVFTISGTPTEDGTFPYTVSTTGDCTSQQTTISGTITVNPDNTITDASNKDQTACINTAIEDMSFPVNSSVTSVNTSGLPAGVNGSISGGNFVLSGTPAESGTFSYILTTTGSCQTATTTGTIIVNPDVTISSPANNNQTICINTAIEDILFEITEPGSGATVSGLPEGLESDFENGILTISGSPTEAGATAGENGIFNYTVQTTGNCVQVSGGGTITVIPDPLATISYPDDICTSITGSINVTLDGSGDYLGGIYSAPSGLTISASSGAITPGSSTPGTYTVTYEGPDTCTPAVATTEVTIIAEPFVEISYEGPFCTSETDLKEPLFTNGVGDYENGSFTSSEPGGLIIENLTGKINAQNSSPGTYDIFYTIDANTGCSEVMVQTEVTITQVPQIIISYPEFICSSETSVPVTISGEDGNYENGVYSGTSGLSIASDGTINPSESSYGAHTVTYTIGAEEGCGEVIAEAGFVIKEVPIITTDPLNTGTCSNSPAQFEVVATGDDLIYQWYKILEDDSVVAIAGEDEAVLNFSNVTAADALRYYVTVSGDDSCIEDTSEIVTLNVDEDIVISEPSEDITICEDTQKDISFIFKGHANGAVLTFDWYKDGEIVTAQNGKIELEVSGPVGSNGEYTGILTIIDPESGEDGDSGVYYVMVDGPDYFTCPEATSKTFTFRVDPRPEAPTVTDKQFCLDVDAGNLTASGEEGNDIKWYTLEEGVYTYIGDNIPIDTSSPTTLEYYATQTKPNGCESDYSEVLTIEILDTPDPVATETIKFEFCYEEEVTDPLSVTPATGADINWYDNAENALGSAPVPLTNSVGTTTYYVSQTFTATGCESDKVAVEVKIKDLPNVNVSIDGGENTICLGSSINFTATGADSYTWYLEETELQAGTTATYTATPTALGENIYTIVGTTDGCTNSYDISVYVDDNTMAGALIAPERICISSGTANVVLESRTGPITKWEYKNASTGNVWTETEDIDLNDSRSFSGLTETTSYRVTVKNGVCDEEYSETTVIVDELPEGGELLWAKNNDRIFLTCEDAVSGYSQLNLSGYTPTASILEWEYRSLSDNSWQVINSTEAYLTSDQIELVMANETTVFRAKIVNGACDTGIYSETAMISVIESDIKPSPVQVDKEVICIGDQITLSSETGYSADGGKFEGGAFQNAGIKNHGWNFTDQDGNPNDFDSAADNGRADHWLRTQPKWKFITADVDTPPYNTTEEWWNSHPDPTKTNEHFAITQGPFSSLMETPVFSLGGMDEAVLTFDQAYNLTPGATIIVEISRDGGNNYNEEDILMYIQGDGTAASRSGYQDHFSTGLEDINQMELDLGGFIGLSNLRIRFNYVGVRVGDVWAVDNIKVPEGPQDILLQWYYDDDLNDPDSYLEPIGDVNQYTVNFIPRKIGWNDFEVQTRIILDSNGDECQSVDNFETIRVWAFDRYTTTVTSEVGACGSLTVILDASVTAEYQAKTITEYPTLDGYEGSWRVEDLNGNEVTTGFTITNQDSSTGLDPIEDPNAIFTAENLGDYDFKWVLTPTALDENNNLIDNSGCPPVENPNNVTLIDCTTLDFDGDDDYIDLGNNYNGNYFIEAWIRPFDRPLDDGSGDTNASTGVIFSSPGFEIAMENLPSGIVKNGRWYHIAVSHNGEIWVDGIASGNITVNASGINNTSIGARYDANSKTTSNHFSGWIDELRIWNGNNPPNLKELRFMMNQRIKLNDAATSGTLIEGEIVPNLDMGDGYSSYNTDGTHNLDQDGDRFYDQTWGDLAGYYRLISAEPDPDGLTECVTFDDNLKPNGGYTPDHSISKPDKVPGRLVNITTDQENTSPTPYCSGADATWANANTWARPDVWDYPNSSYSGTAIDWNIARINHNINSSNKDITMLGLLSETVDKKLSINPNHFIRISHYLLLDGNMDLEGESQLLQDHGSILDNASSGWAEIDQQGRMSSFNYNYWTSPFSNQGADNNSGFMLNQVLFDGSNANSPQPVNFQNGYFVADKPKTSPLTISNEWIWDFRGGVADLYGDWEHLGSDFTEIVGAAYSMKGTDGTVGLSAKQNYTFRGKPNNGNIPTDSLYLQTNQNFLVGNPYPSAIDAYKFINDNVKINGGSNVNNENVFNGSIYFWDHFSGKTHILEEYIGGYAVLTKASGIPAISNDWRIDNSDPNLESNKTPKRFIPVAQGFFLNSQTEGSVTFAGDIIFNNTQRVYRPKDGTSSLFLSQEKSTSRSEKGYFELDERAKIRLKFNSPAGYHRQILVTKDENTTNEFDLGYDAPLIEDNLEDMYWMVNDNPYVIQAVPDFEQEQVLPLAIKVKSEGEFSIQIDSTENWPEGKNIYLKDKKLDSIHLLGKQAYKATSTPGEAKDRFELVFFDPTKEKPEIEDLPVVEGIGITYSRSTKEVKINNDELLEVSKVMIFDMGGKLIQEFEGMPTEREILLGMRPVRFGIYIVKVFSEKGVSNKKIIIK